MQKRSGFHTDNKKTYRSARTMRRRSDLRSIIKKPNAFGGTIANSGGGGTTSKARNRAAEGQCANGQAECKPSGERTKRKRSALRSHKKKTKRASKPQYKSQATAKR